MFYRDKNGKKQDAALHADMLNQEDDISFTVGIDAILLQGRINRDDWRDDKNFRAHWDRIKTSYLN